MRITAVKTLVCNARMRNWIFVKIETDQLGLIGWGEATLEWHTRAVLGAVEDIAQLIVGEDPQRIEHLWQMMFRQHYFHGSGVVRSTAISGVDMALWDIAGKIRDVPCHMLWGGRVRDWVRLYAHLGGGGMEGMYDTPVADAARFAELAAAMVEQGYTAFKAMAVPPTTPLEGRQQVAHAERAVAAMRDAVGPGIDIMVDCHARPSPAMGMLFAEALDPYGLYFLEEPCWPEHVDALARINAAVATPIATGERLTHVTQFRDLFAARACDIAQPDITHCGGFSSLRRISALAAAYGVALAPHNPAGPVSSAAAFEVGLSDPAFVICETVGVDVPWREEVVRSLHPLDTGRRRIGPSAAPGLGVEIDEAAVARFPFQQELQQRVFYPDGAVGDW